MRYEQVNAMLLNEFLKAHRKMQEQQATIAKQQKQIEAFTTGFQKSERTPSPQRVRVRVEVKGI